MRLKSYQIKNYRSIKDTGVILLSNTENVAVLAGQNESGKSSILCALRDFESGNFEEDSRPFSSNETLNQSVQCTYLVEESDDIIAELTGIMIDDYSLNTDEAHIFDEDKLKAIKEFTILKVNDAKGEISTSIDRATFDIFTHSILRNIVKAKNETPDTPEPLKEGVSEEAPIEVATPPKNSNLIPIFSEEQNSDVESIFWQITPRIVFFDDFCDLLPDKIYISNLKEEKEDSEGYKAVKNIERILGTNFVQKDEEGDAVRRTKEDADNDEISINFQEDWGQRIHDQNKVLIKYIFEKRKGEGEEGSYINFFVETKKGELLPPRKRSKGLVWFLSLWLELQAQDIDNEDLILLLDEPDQHLHVRAQEDVLRLIEKLANKENTEAATKGDQIMYATHSPYLIDTNHLNRIKLVLNTPKSGTKVEDITTSQINTKYKKDALQPIADAIGLNSIQLSKLNNKSILLEGVSDFYYFEAMKKILGEENKKYNFIPGIGLRKIENLISFCIGYGLRWVAIIDDDPIEGGKDTLNKFEEIRKFVFDGDEVSTTNKIHILKGIVGIENMFTIGDLKLVDSNINDITDKSKAVGNKRKILFGKLFFEKVLSGNITRKNLSKTALQNFKKAFEFIEKNI